MGSFNSSLFVAGPYSATYGGASLGIFAGDQQSPTIELVPKAQPIDNTDAWGRTTLGAIHQGADAFFQAIMLEWSATTKAALWPFAALGLVGAIGYDHYGSSVALVLTAIAGGLAATLGPTSITASNAYLAPNFSPRLLLGPVLREQPLRLQLYPFISTNAKHFTTAG